MAVITSSPYTHGPNQVSLVMIRVIYALLPALAVYGWMFGWGVLTNQLIAIAVALASEAMVMKLRNRPVKPALFDGSALVTAVLLAFALPPFSPWWLITIGILFAIVMAKHLYGGLGYNPFNPAMAGYVVLLISFPLEMTQWLPPAILRPEELNLSATLGYVFTGQLPGGATIDAFTMATPLDTLKTALGLDQSVAETMSSSPVFGKLGGVRWELVNGLLLLGGTWMIFKRVISWHVPVAVLGSLFLISTLFWLINPVHYADPMFHLFTGGAILGAFFIATDPVSGATSEKGRIVFGVGIGILEYTIRVWGGYPDGIAFSVLLMNMAAPTIDYYTQPRVYGEQGK
jgi:electron transport complex protein RnfD